MTMTPKLPPDARLPAIAVTDWGGVFLESGRNRAVLCLLPQSDPGAIERVPRAPEAGAVVEALVVVNDASLGGAIGGTVVQERLGIDLAEVYATDPSAPIDRPGTGAARLVGAALPRKLRRGPLSLRRRGGAGVLEARWRLGGEEVRALVGAAISFSLLAARPHPHLVVGSMALPAEGVEPPPAEAFESLVEVTLVAGAPPDTAEAMARFWSALGVPVKVVEHGANESSTRTPAWVEGAVQLVDALREGADERVRAALAAMPPPEVEATLVGLSARGDVAEARRLAALAIESVGAPGRLWLQRGSIELMAGDPGGAERCWRAAIEGADPCAEAASALAALLTERGEHGEAREMADRALAALPADPGALQAALVARAAAGDADGALALLAERGGGLDGATRSALEAALADPGRLLAARLTARRFPRHAALMIEIGRAMAEEGRLAEALEPLRRAVALDPTSLAAAADLGRTLSELGRDEEAVAVYDGAIDRALAGELLRYNRGNARVRLGRLEEAVADYERCRDLVPTWIEPRVNLVAALHALGRLDEARAAADEVERLGPDPELLAAVRALLAGGCRL
jgi:tetratricopeptide (TPR) repeat protein